MCGKFHLFYWFSSLGASLIKNWQVNDSITVWGSMLRTLKSENTWCKNILGTLIFCGDGGSVCGAWDRERTGHGCESESGAGTQFSRKTFGFSFWWSVEFGVDRKGWLERNEGIVSFRMDFCKKQPTVVVVHFTIAKYYITRILGPLRGPTSSWIQDTRRNTVKELWRNTESKKIHWEIQKKSLRNFKKICILVLKSFFLPKIVSEFVGHFDTSRFPTALR